MSEGLDFSDNNGRAVIITGLPFPSSVDPKIIIKRKYVDDIKTQADKQGKNTQNYLTGNLWYQQCASRAVNQAIGRV